MRTEVIEDTSAIHVEGSIVAHSIWQQQLGTHQSAVLCWAHYFSAYDYLDPQGTKTLI